MGIETISSSSPHAPVETSISTDDVFPVLRFLVEAIHNKSLPMDQRIDAASAFVQLLKPIGVATPELVEAWRKSNS